MVQLWCGVGFDGSATLAKRGDEQASGGLLLAIGSGGVECKP
jgi:hypothetical protein